MMLFLNIKQIILIFFFITLYFLNTSIYANSVIDNEILACQDLKCLQKELKQAKNPVTLKDCNVLNGKKSTGFSNPDMGLMCRMTVARLLAGQRSNDRCNRSDYEPDLEEFEMDLYREEIFKKLKDKFKDKSFAKYLNHKANRSGGTIYDTYLSKSIGYAQYNDNDIEYTVNIFFCTTGYNPEELFSKNTHKYVKYQPYYYELKLIHKIKNSSDKIIKDYTYVDLPSFSKDKIFNQLPKKLLKFIEEPKLVDINNDGFSDLLFIDDSLCYSRTIQGLRAAICIYDPKGKS